MWYIKNSDNFEDCTMSSMDYDNLRLEMSTGDFHTHEAYFLGPRLYVALGLEFIKPNFAQDKITGEWHCTNDDLIGKGE